VSASIQAVVCLNRSTSQGVDAPEQHGNGSAFTALSFAELYRSEVSGSPDEQKADGTSPVITGKVQNSSDTKMGASVSPASRACKKPGLDCGALLFLPALLTPELSNAPPVISKPGPEQGILTGRGLASTVENSPTSAQIELPDEAICNDFSMHGLKTDANIVKPSNAPDGSPEPSGAQASGFPPVSTTASQDSVEQPDCPAARETLPAVENFAANLGNCGISQSASGFQHFEDVRLSARGGELSAKQNPQSESAENVSTFSDNTHSLSSPSSEAQRAADGAEIDAEAVSSCLRQNLAGDGAPASAASREKRWRRAAPRILLEE